MTYEEDEFVKEKLQKEDYAVRILKGQTLLNVSKDKIDKQELEEKAKEVFDDWKFSYKAGEYTSSYEIEVPAIKDFTMVSPESSRLKAINNWNLYFDGEIGVLDFLERLGDKRVLNLIEGVEESN